MLVVLDLNAVCVGGCGSLSRFQDLTGATTILTMNSAATLNPYYHAMTSHNTEGLGTEL